MVKMQQGGEPISSMRRDDHCNCHRLAPFSTEPESSWVCIRRAAQIEASALQRVNRHGHVLSTKGRCAATHLFNISPFRHKVEGPLGTLVPIARLNARVDHLRSICFVHLPFHTRNPGKVSAKAGTDRGSPSKRPTNKVDVQRAPLG